ncbi:MAG: hypothetical protein ACUVQU_07660 [Candidatus Bipolaricaulia bacterium]
MKKEKGKGKGIEIKLPPEEATDEQIVEFLRSHDPEELLRQGILEIDGDYTDLKDALLAWLSEPVDTEFIIHMPRKAKWLLEELAQRKGLDATTLARTWIIEGLSKEVM